MKRLICFVVSLSLLSVFMALPVSARPTLSCGTPIHMAMVNGHYTTASAYQFPGTNTYAQMDAWSPDSTLQQTMDVCSLSEWDATVTETSSSNPRVVTYPDSDYRLTHYDGTCTYSPDWATTTAIQSNWAISAPQIGDWDQSYDLWMGTFGGCVDGSNPQVELMVYTNTHGNVFAPTPLANFTIANGTNYDAWWSYSAGVSARLAARLREQASVGSLYIQVRLHTYATSGTTKLRQIIQSLHGGGYTYLNGGVATPLMPAHERLSDIQYGVEDVSGTDTAGAGPITFHLTNFTATVS